MNKLIEKFKQTKWSKFRYIIRMDNSYTMVFTVNGSIVGRNHSIGYNDINYNSQTKRLFLYGDFITLYKRSSEIERVEFLEFMENRFEFIITETNDDEEYLNRNV